MKPTPSCVSQSAVRVQEIAPPVSVVSTSIVSSAVSAVPVSVVSVSAVVSEPVSVSVLFAASSLQPTRAVRNIPLASIFIHALPTIFMFSNSCRCEKAIALS